VPYQSSGGRRNNVQLGVGQSIWAGTPPSAIPERVLDGIPGYLAWLALFLCIILSFVYPRTLLLIAAVVGFYSAIRFLIAGIANVIGLRKIRQWNATDWDARYREHDSLDVMRWDDVLHVVLVPAYKEPYAVMQTTLNHLAQQHEAHRRMVIILAMEAAEENCAEKAEQLVREFQPCFAHIYYTVHPRGLPGEMQCKSANEAWAARWAKRRLVDELGYDLDNILVTTMDADTIWHPQHFHALTYLFATHPQRHLRIWQAPIRYHGNIWEINPLLRLVNAYSGAFELAYLAASWWKPMPMSSYALSLRLLDSSGYWDSDVIADEWHMFIKSYFARGGKVQLERMFLPFLAQAATGENLWEAFKARYQQTLRHAWGSKEVGYMLAKMLEHPEIEFLPAARLLLRIAHDILLAGAGWIILTVGSQLPYLVHPGLLSEVVNEGLSNPTFVLLQISFLLVSILGIVFWYQDVSARPPRPHPQTLGESLLTLISFPLLTILTLFLVAIPTLQAQTRLMVGIPLQFRVTKKV
jgi:cellulose synthase/poly-beta-1,6-N-acetylglucosamine synthase-like glycosyltransferase